jgi:hypothetical protein
LPNRAVVSTGAGMMTHVLAIVPFLAEEAGRGACALSARVGLRVTAVIRVVGGVVGSAAVVADHGGGGSRAVSDHVSEPMASVTLGQGGAVVKFPGPAVGSEKGGRGATDQLETGAVWVIE